jgi:hypothetical protein
VAAIADQVFKQIEDLRLNGHNGVPAAELAPLGVKDVTVEHKNQLLRPKARLHLAAPLLTGLP